MAPSINAPARLGSNSVSRRIPEIGLRVALGATPGDVLRIVGRHSLVLAGSGVIGVLGAVAALATLAPALRALRVDPMAALRYE